MTWTPLHEAVVMGDVAALTPLGSWRRGNGVTLPPRVRRPLPQALSQTPRIADTRRRSVWLTREL